MFDQLLLTINAWMGAGAVLALAGSFLWGLVSVLFSPCHLASIPLMVGYVAGQGRLVEGREAAGYALVFTAGLFASIGLVGVACAALGRMLGDIGPWWTAAVGAVLLLAALDMLGLATWRLPGFGARPVAMRGLPGALVLGLGYGLLSGACTFGFLAPLLAVITVQGDLAAGTGMVLAFALGHCLPIALAGGSASLARRMLERFARGATWVRRMAGVLVGALGTYYILQPFFAA